MLVLYSSLQIIVLLENARTVEPVSTGLIPTSANVLQDSKDLIALFHLAQVINEW